jgi:hypothetical protein
MRRIAALCLLVSLPAFADSEGTFSTLKDNAEKYDGSLSAFLDKYVGECSDPATMRECKEAATQFRKKVTGKRFFFLIGEEQASSLSPGKWFPNGEFTINLTPFFAAGNYAVSQSSPHHTDPQGNPVFPWVTMKGKASDVMEAQRTLREVSMRSVRVELVFTPESVWALPKKGGGKQYGVKASFNGVRAISGMTGQAIATVVH